MGILIFFIVIIFLVGIFTKPLRKESSDEDRKVVHFIARNGYQKRRFLMDSNESALFYELERQLPKGYHVFPKMRIADIIDATQGIGLRYRKNKILPKHADFVICNSYFNPIVAIELNGSSHNRPDRIESDNLKKEIFQVAGLPFKTINVGEDFSKEVKELTDFYCKI